MGRLDKISEALHGLKDVVIFCNKALLFEIEEELTALNDPVCYGQFKNGEKNTKGSYFKSILYNGVTLHLADEETFVKIMEKN